MGAVQKVIKSRGTAQSSLKDISTEEMLREISSRGGHPKALADAALLCIKKSQDYNSSSGPNPHTIDRTSYFPFGTVSYAQMLHTKTARFLSLTGVELAGGTPNFEGLRDTALDIINYAGFYCADPRSFK